MYTNPELSIVIPTRNEASYLPSLLTSLSTQDYPRLRHTRVFVADAASTDDTAAIALSFQNRLNISVIEGGLPAAGRNAGARLAESEFLLFLDADVQLADSTLVRRALSDMRRRRLHCATTSVGCIDGRFRDRLLYRCNNFVQRVASFVKPFGTGMFLLIRRGEFERLGGFNEQAQFAEDYLLTKQIAVRRFGIIRGEVLTTNRRFRRIGHRRMVYLFLCTMLNSWNEAYFLKDQRYWDADLAIRQR